MLSTSRGQKWEVKAWKLAESFENLRTSSNLQPSKWCWCLAVPSHEAVTWTMNFIAKALHKRSVFYFCSPCVTLQGPEVTLECHRASHSKSSDRYWLQFHISKGEFVGVLALYIVARWCKEARKIVQQDLSPACIKGPAHAASPCLGSCLAGSGRETQMTQMMWMCEEQTVAQAPHGTTWPTHGNTCIMGMP